MGSVAVRGSDPGDGVTIKSRGEGYPGDMRPGRWLCRSSAHYLQHEDLRATSRAHITNKERKTIKSQGW